MSHALPTPRVLAKVERRRKPWRPPGWLETLALCLWTLALAAGVANIAVAMLIPSLWPLPGVAMCGVGLFDFALAWVAYLIWKAERDRRL